MTNPTIKNCSTCVHGKGSRLGEDYRYCKLDRYYCSTVMRFPSISVCSNLSQWAPKPPTIWQQIGKAILARISRDNQP